MGTFYISTDVTFVRSDIYQLKSAIPKIYFHIAKLVLLLDLENCSSTFYLVTLSEELDCDRKNGEQKNA